MKKLRAICVTVLLALTLSAPAFAGDGIMGTGGQDKPGGRPVSITGIMGTGAPQPAQITPTDGTAAQGEFADQILLAVELTIWQSIIAQL